ncbi:MAG: HdeD family acid-resistance protein [Mesorhizobium sp.]
MTTDTTTPSGRPMLHALAKGWWLILLRGIAAILFGLLAFVMPGIALATLVLLYGAYAFVDGIFALIAAFGGQAKGERWWLALIGLLGIGVGIVTLLMPGLTAFTLLYFIAFWSIAIGVMQIVGAINLRKEIDNEWWLILGGVLSILFGVLLIVAPGAGAVGLIWTIASFAIVYGVTLVMLAFRLRKHVH